MSASAAPVTAPVPSAAPTTPPSPSAPTPPSPAPTEPQAAGEAPTGEPGETAAEGARPAKKGVSLYDLEPDARAKAAKSEPPTPTVAPKPSGPVPRPSAAEPATADSRAAPPPFVAPSSAHVTLDLSKGLKHDLANDTRMAPWLAGAVATANHCYEQAQKNKADLAGVIELGLTMHENERPTPDIKKLPPDLSAIVTCVSGAMLSRRPPLFTGKEGQKYTAKIRFRP